MFEKIRQFCIQNKYFKAGTSSQYEKLFELANEGASKHDLALIIYVCSDNDSLETIENKLEMIL